MRLQSHYKPALTSSMHCSAACFERHCIACYLPNYLGDSCRQTGLSQKQRQTVALLTWVPRRGYQQDVRSHSQQAQRQEGGTMRPAVMAARHAHYDESVSLRTTGWHQGTDACMCDADEDGDGTMGGCKVCQSSVSADIPDPVQEHECCRGGGG